MRAQDAGPVALGNIDMRGQNVAGRDLNYVVEGFRIRSRMRPAARRVLHWGVALMLVGFLVSLGAILVYQQLVFDAGSDSGFGEEGFDFGDGAAAFAVAGGGALISFGGLAMTIGSLLMRREKISEAVLAPEPYIDGVRGR